MYVSLIRGSISLKSRKRNQNPRALLQTLLAASGRDLGINLASVVEGQGAGVLGMRRVTDSYTFPPQEIKAKLKSLEAPGSPINMRE